MRAIGRAINAIINWLVSAQGKIAGYAVLVMTLMVTMDVILRFVFNAPTNFATEITAYLLVVSVSFGLAYTLKERAHIRIDLIISHLPRRATRWLQVFTSIISAFFTGFLCWLSWSQVAKSFALQTTSRTGLDVVIWPFQLFIPMGLALICLLLLLNIYNETRAALRKAEETELKEEKVDLWTG